MNRVYRNPLTFSSVDALAFAAERDRLEGQAPEIPFTPSDLGPLFEHFHLSTEGLLPPLQSNSWLVLSSVSPMIKALADGKSKWICPHNKNCGFMQVGVHASQDRLEWVSFRLAAQKAAVSVGFHKKTAAQLIGAFGELQSNIEEHSGAPETGLAVFNAIPGRFEFVISDHGMGVLSSLQTNSDYMHLSNHGDALVMALTEGCSRFGEKIGRGYGFRPLFIGLANLRGSLRFRTGDHALTIDGYNPTLMNAKIAQKAQMNGFFSSVCCVL